MNIENGYGTQEAKEYFETYINSKIENRKYFYWNLDYFERIDNISFKYYELTSSQKEIINTQGKLVFDDDNIVFSIKTNSLRYELDIKNLSTKIPRYYHHSLYLKEYILLKIMQDDSGNSFEKFKPQQEINFVYSYLKYATDNSISFPAPQFVSFNRTQQYPKLIDSFDTNSDNEEIKKDIKELKARLETLRVLREIETKITFLFKLPNVEKKEELRFALSELSGKDLFFRGQANSDWSINPSIARSQSLLNNEHQLFQKILALKPNDFANDTTDYEKLITMQHYGLPTRLLDLTRNPLISIFFACNNLDRKNQDGLVYIFENKEKEFLNPDDEKVTKLMKIMKLEYSVIGRTEEFQKNMYCDNHFIRGVAKNQRINNQSGDFIFVGLSENSKENKNVEEFVDRYLIIDYKVKPILLENLEVMNIHGGSVYPELGNMSSYLVDKYQ